MNQDIDAAVIAELRRPFQPDDVQYKIQTVGQKALLCVAYVDARHVSERLNKVVPELWSTEYEPVSLGVNGIVCKLTIDGCTRADVGSFDNVNEDQHGLKAVFSDAFKRAAVHFGVAVSLYAHPQSFIDLKETTLYRTGKGDKPVGITRGGNEYLRESYVKFLANKETKETYGEPL